MTDSDSNLRSLFARALTMQAQLDTLRADSDEYKVRLASTIASFLQCQTIANSLSIFSPNETVDDIASGDLAYLSIDYHIASLLPFVPQSPTANSAPSSPSTIEERKSVLHSAQGAYADFLERLASYSLLSGEDKRLFQRFSADKDAFEVLAGAGGGDAAGRRATKIARFKKERELRQKLEHSYHDVSVSADEDEDETSRDLTLTRLSLYTHQAFHALDQLAQELRILALAASAPAPSPPSSISSSVQDSRVRQTTDTYSERLDSLPGLGSGTHKGPLLDHKGKPAQPFVLLDARTREQRRVFQPGHSLPTMSIDEYLEAEKARGGMIDGGGNAGGEEVWVDEDDMEAADRETEKKRAWDEFVEANPKGSGNTLNRG